MRKCKQCGCEYDKGYSFCPKCGGTLIEKPKKQNKSCPNCRVKVSEEYNFCPECGFKVDGENQTLNESDTGSVGPFHFDNRQEMKIYIEDFAKDNKVLWASRDAYLNKQREADTMFEERRYHEAIDALNEALNMNPIGIEARFKKSEMEIQLGDLDEAEKTLIEMKDFLYKDAMKDRFYKLLQFIKREKRKYAGGVSVENGIPVLLNWKWASKTNNCPECGFKVKGKTYCPQCGVKIEAIRKEVQPSAVKENKKNRKNPLNDSEEKKTTSNPMFGYAMFSFLMSAGIAAFGWLLELIVGSGWTLRIFSGLGWGLGVGCSVIGAIVFVGLLLYGLYDDHRYR